MLQTYQGYFQDDGRFVPDSLMIKIPTGRRAIVNILDEEVIVIKSNRQQQQKKAVYDFIRDNHASDSELTAEDFAEFESGKYKMKFDRKELDL